MTYHQNLTECREFINRLFEGLPHNKEWVVRHIKEATRKLREAGYRDTDRDYSPAHVNLWVCHMLVSELYHETLFAYETPGYQIENCVRKARNHLERALDEMSR